MSQSTALKSPARAPRPGPRTPQRTAPPRLRVVSAPRHTRSRAGLVAACVALLVAGLVGLLLLNVNLERGTYELRDQASRAQQLREQKQRLEEETRERSSPVNLDGAARRQGMVDAPPSPVFLQGHRTLGVPMPAPTPSRPTVTPKSAPSVAGKTPTVTTTAGTAGRTTTTTPRSSTTPTPHH